MPSFSPTTPLKVYYSILSIPHLTKEASDRKPFADPDKDAGHAFKLYANAGPHFTGDCP